jgi:hypothetical protein
MLSVISNAQAHDELGQHRERQERRPGEADDALTCRYVGVEVRGFEPLASSVRGIEHVFDWSTQNPDLRYCSEEKVDCLAWVA